MHLPVTNQAKCPEFDRREQVRESRWAALAFAKQTYVNKVSRKIRLIASGRDGFGSGCVAIQASRAASSSG